MYQTDKPFGFLNKDLLWIIQNINKEIVVVNDTNDYTSTPHKKKKVFLINGITIYSYLCMSSKSSKLKGRFIVLDTEECLTKIKAIILDRDNMEIDFNSFIKESLPYIRVSNTNFKTSLYKESKNFIKTISSRVLNQNKVFKKTYQNINLELLELGKKVLPTKKFNTYKKYLSELLCKVCVNYLPYEEILEIKLGKDIIKNKDGYNDVVKFCSTPSSIRTIRAFHDIAINKTPIEKAVIDNYADIYTLNMMLDSWKPKGNVSFKENYSRKLHKSLGCLDKNSLINKELVKRRSSKELTTFSGSFKFKLHKGIIKLDTLISKLNLPEDEYRVIGNEIKDGKVTIDKEPFALHGINSNYIFSIGC